MLNKLVHSHSLLILLLMINLAITFHSLSALCLYVFFKELSIEDYQRKCVLRYERKAIYYISGVCQLSLNSY